MLISHSLHYDHLDLPSLQRLDRGFTVVVPKGAGPRAAEGSSVVEVAAGDLTQVGLWSSAPRAEHGSSRALGARSDGLGYVVEGSRRVYFPATPTSSPRWRSCARARPRARADLGLGTLPGAGASRPSAARGRGVGPPAARPAVPIHWWTYYPVQSTRWKSPAFLTEPVREFERWAAELAPDVDVRVLQVGEELEPRRLRIPVAEERVLRLSRRGREPEGDEPVGAWPRRRRCSTPARISMRRGRPRRTRARPG